MSDLSQQNYQHHFVESVCHYLCEVVDMYTNNHIYVFINLWRVHKFRKSSSACRVWRSIAAKGLFREQQGTFPLPSSVTQSHRSFYAVVLEGYLRVRYMFC